MDLRLTLLLVLLVTFTSACGGRVDVESRYDPEPGETDPEYSQSATYRSEGDLERADRLVRESDFEGAITIYRALYRNEGQSDARAQALYGWARAEGHMLNPSRNVDEAIARLELLLEEFPDADVAFRAREELRRMRSWRGQPDED